MNRFAKTCSLYFIVTCALSQAYAADPLALSELKGFSAGMKKEQVEAVLDTRGIHYEKSGDKPTVLGWIMYGLGKCPKKNWLGVCKEEYDSGLTIGGAEINVIYYYPATQTIELGFEITDGMEINQQEYSDAQTVVNALLAQHSASWEVSDVECGDYGCKTTRSLHQGNGRFISVSQNEGGMPYIAISLSKNLGSADMEDF